MNCIVWCLSVFNTKLDPVTNCAANLGKCLWKPFDQENEYIHYKQIDRFFYFSKVGELRLLYRDLDLPYADKYY